MVNFRAIIWETFLEPKRYYARPTIFGFTNSKPKIGETLTLKVALVEDGKIHWVTMLTNVVRKVKKVNSDFIEFETKHSNFMICRRQSDVKIKIASDLENSSDEAVYSSNSIHICKSNQNKKWVCVLTS